MDREVSGNGREGVAIYRAGQVGTKANLVGAKSHQVAAQQAVAHEKQKFQGHSSPLSPIFHTVSAANRQNDVREKSFSSLDTDDRSNFLGT